MLGLGLFAILTGILTSGFSEHIREEHAGAAAFTYCPHGGHRL